MNTIKDKQWKEYSYTSRYSAFPFYYQTLDDKYFYGLGKQLDNTTSYTEHTLRDSDTLDSLALTYYGRPDYYWIIADFNRIQDPFIKLMDKFTTVKIPSLSSISWKG